MIPSDLIKAYLEEKFPDNRVFGNEFTVNSIFVDDQKYHLSINLETGLWQDFKAHESGNFPQLVSIIEEIPLEKALIFLRSKVFDSPELLFDVSSLKDKEVPAFTNSISDIFKSFEIFSPNDIDSNSLVERVARKFVFERKLSEFQFYISKRGKYCNRLIIPYSYDNNKTVFFFQARSLIDKFGRRDCRYLTPPSRYGVKSSETLFPFNDKADYVFVVEGPFDAISMQLNGLNATCTQGSILSNSQADQIKDKQIIFAYDNDEAGRAGMKRARETLLRKNVSQFCIATLPDNIKDWNELHMVSSSKDEFVSTVMKGLRPYDFEQSVISRLS